MKLSIIIVSFNTKKVTLDCIESIYSAKINMDYEIILIDNNSVDGSEEAFRKIKKSNFKLVLNDTNLGFSKANNLGLKESKGEYKLLLNSDTLVAKGQIEKLINFAGEHLDAAVVVPRLLNKDKTVQPSVYRLPNFNRVVRQYLLNKGPILDKYTPDTDSFEQVECAVAAVFLITPIGYKKVGFMDERYFMYFEDFDYCRKVKQLNLKIYYLATSHFIHLHGESGKNIVKAKDQWKRLIPSSKIYYGYVGHYLFSSIIWISQKIKKY